MRGASSRLQVGSLHLTPGSLIRMAAAVTTHEALTRGESDCVGSAYLCT